MSCNWCTGETSTLISCFYDNKCTNKQCTRVHQKEKKQACDKHFNQLQCPCCINKERRKSEFTYPVSWCKNSNCSYGVDCFFRHKGVEEYMCHDCFDDWNQLISSASNAQKGSKEKNLVVGSREYAEKHNTNKKPAGPILTLAPLKVDNKVDNKVGKGDMGVQDQLQWTAAMLEETKLEEQVTWAVGGIEMRTDDGKHMDEMEKKGGFQIWETSGKQFCINFTISPYTIQEAGADGKIEKLEKVEEMPDKHLLPSKLLGQVVAKMDKQGEEVKMDKQGDVFHFLEKQTGKKFASIVLNSNFDQHVFLLGAMYKWEIGKTKKEDMTVKLVNGALMVDDGQDMVMVGSYEEQ